MTSKVSVPVDSADSGALKARAAMRGPGCCVDLRYGYMSTCLVVNAPEVRDARARLGGGSGTIDGWHPPRHALSPPR